jgi:hypothetical protein
MKTISFLRTTALTFSALIVMTSYAELAKGDFITWTTAQDTTDVTNISQNGVLVSAFNAGPPGGTSVTANGVEFQTVNPFQFGVTSFLGGGDTGDSEFNRLLNQVSFNFNNANPGVGEIDLGTFNTGDNYEIQVFFTDQRSNSNDRTVFYGSNDGTGNGSEVELAGDPNQDVAAPFGQFAIGTFTGDGNDPNLLVRAGANHNSAQITAWQIRNLSAVPEPSSMIYLTTLGVVFALRRRRV